MHLDAGAAQARRAAQVRKIDDETRRYHLRARRLE
jgi:hypothetical protein